ncbi:MAG: hypothetical protein U1F45_04015 [Burkholderiales bacterium]
MRQRVLAGTGLEASELGLGTMTCGAQTDEGVLAAIEAVDERYPSPSAGR